MLTVVGDCAKESAGILADTSLLAAYAIQALDQFKVGCGLPDECGCQAVHAATRLSQMQRLILICISIILVINSLNEKPMQMENITINDESPSKAATKEVFMPIMRELVKAYQTFSNYSARHVREMGLTPPQFDVISTLGNTSGMPLHKLADETLITKGTLTGIIDRLEQKGLLRRVVPIGNRRSFIAVLTLEGERVFEEVFPAHIIYLKKRFGQLSEKELEQARVVLKRLREIF